MFFKIVGCQNLYSRHTDLNYVKYLSDSLHEQQKGCLQCHYTFWIKLSCMRSSIQCQSQWIFFALHTKANQTLITLSLNSRETKAEVVLSRKTGKVHLQQCHRSNLSFLFQSHHFTKKSTSFRWDHKHWMMLPSLPHKYLVAQTILPPII